MENKIPLPTDNIFKFYALFSLLLLIFGLGCTLFLHEKMNNQLISYVIDLETLKQEATPSPTQQVRKELLEKQIEVTIADKKFYIYALAIISGLSTLGMYYGFQKWHTTIQPLADEAARVQLEIAKLQLQKMQYEINKLKD